MEGVFLWFFATFFETNISQNSSKWPLLTKTFINYKKKEETKKKTFLNYINRFRDFG